MNDMAAAAGDVVLRVNVVLLHVLLMRVRMTRRADLRRNHSGGIRWIGQLVGFRIVHMGGGIPRVAAGTRHVGFGVTDPDLMDTADERLDHPLVTIDAILADLWKIFGGRSIRRKKGEAREYGEHDGK